MSEIKQVGDYKLLERLGGGGAADVYLATPTKTKIFAAPGELVAVKLYKERFLSQNGQLDRMTREFQIGSQISNPYLTRIYECNFQDSVPPFLVMEFIDGMPLSEWITMFHPASEQLLLKMLMRIAKGLEALHHAGIIHRDIKPENIMIPMDFSPKIMDYGVAKISDHPGKTPPESFLGTIRNASPEWLRREDQPEYEPQVDLYSFGTVVYAMLHGHQVFHEENEFARLVDLVKNAKPQIDESLLAKRQPIPALVKLTERLLEKNPANRPASIEAVIAALTAAETQSSLSPSERPLHGYMAAALTGISEELRDALAFKSRSIANVCKEFELYVYQPRMSTDPLLHPSVSPEIVYFRDRSRVLSADLLILMADQPSFGVGQEIEIAGGYGVPAIIIGSEKTKCKVSRMVRGSYLNTVGEVYYQSPEDLDQKLRHLLSEKQNLLRSFKNTPRSNIGGNIGAKLQIMRQQAAISIEEAAHQVGISPRLLRAFEERPLNFHNAGIHTIGRLLTRYGKVPSDLFGPSTEHGEIAPLATDGNIIRLEGVAQRAGWPTADFLALREDYQKTLVASGDTQMVNSEEWLRRHAVLDNSKLKTDRAKSGGLDQADLLDFQ